MSQFELNNLIQDYGDPVQEAKSCRTSCALFDFSFVQRARVEGENALGILHQFQPRNLSRLKTGRIAYSVTLDEGDFVKSDLTIWRIAKDTYEIMSGRAQDIGNLSSLAPQDAVFNDFSAETSVFALQGPNVLNALQGITDIHKLKALTYFCHVATDIAEIPCRVGRLGYTGERGIEIITARDHHHDLWQILAARARPAGFNAIDTLRIEAGFWLFTNECAIDVTVSELGVGHLVGHPVDRQRYRLVSFQADYPFDAVTWRPGEETLKPPEPDQITVTSACNSVVFSSVVGLGFINANEISDCLVDPRGEFTNIQLTSHPVYDPKKRIPRGDW